jgi:copper chaperone CopZ
MSLHFKFIFTAILFSGLVSSASSFACDEHAEGGHGKGHHHDKVTKGAASEDEHSAWLSQEDQTLTGTVSMHVAGMMCSSCRTKLEGAIKKLPEIDTVMINLKNKSMTLALKSPLPRGKLSQAMTAAGFSLVKPPAKIL